ncbi:MAG: WD40 repeat domain-containing protein [bacterium]
MQSLKFAIAWGFNPRLKKKLLLLFLFFTLFFITQKIEASFFDPSPFTQDYGDGILHAYATQWNPAGTHLAVGGINYPNDVTIYEWDGQYLETTNSINFGAGAFALSWSPNGQYLAVGGDHNYNSLIIYKWDGVSLTLTTSKYHGTQVNAVSWNPAGDTLAVGGVWGNNPLVMYSWDGLNSLTLTTSKYHGTQVNTLAWHPDGTKLAVGGIYGTRDVILYGWSNPTLTPITSLDHGSETNALDWSSTGSFLAVGGANTPNDIGIYMLSGSTLIQKTTATFGTKAKTLAFSFDDTILAVGGINPGSDLLVYQTSIVSAYPGFAYLNPVSSSQTSYGNGVYSVAWTPYSDYLAVAGDNGSSDLTIYKNHNYLNGTKNNITLTDKYVFSGDGVGFVIGSVTFKNGCDMGNTWITMALTEPFSGELANASELILENDLYLNSNTTIASVELGFYGNGHTIHLGGDLIIPDASTFYIDNDTAIDGNGHSLILGNQSNLNVGNTVTLTLRNLTLKNTVNTQALPPIVASSSTAKIALDNVKLALTDDFYFPTGQLFIHNDVMFTGTSKFIYKSPYQSYITKNATLYFGPHTIFKYNPNSTNNNLIAMQDASSSLYLDGCTLQLTHTGLRLSKGQIYLENSVTFTSPYSEINPSDASTSYQSASTGLILGNSILGPDYNLNIDVLGGANINQHCFVTFDEA